MQFNYVVVGAGFAGSVMAERISNVLGENVLLIDKRRHIGGNAFDTYDENGILIHKYGPHIFHTRVESVWRYLSQFTEWRPYIHRVLGEIDGALIPIPFNLNGLHQVVPNALAKRIEEALVNEFGVNSRVPILKLRESNNQDLSFIANFVYEKVFLHYTEKQWGVTPEEIDPTVTGRVPIVVGRDDRYFRDRYQAMPANGYTRMFEKMLDNPRIKVMLNTDFKEIISVNHSTKELSLLGQPFKGHLIYTGELDYFFDYSLGKLPYRSLKFEFESHNMDYFQQTGTINYPNEYDFTRITEFKHLTGQRASSTTIVKEYPQSYIPGENLPYYPIKNSDNFALLRKYNAEAINYSNVIFLGRLAEYQYYDMDAVVAKSIKVFEEKILPLREEGRL